MQPCLRRGAAPRSEQQGHADEQLLVPASDQPVLVSQPPTAMPVVSDAAAACSASKCHAG